MKNGHKQPVIEIVLYMFVGFCNTKLLFWYIVALFIFAIISLKLCFKCGLIFGLPELKYVELKYVILMNLKNLIMAYLLSIG
jgi:hypothetical protein